MRLKIKLSIICIVFCFTVDGANLTKIDYVIQSVDISLVKSKINDRESSIIFNIKACNNDTVIHYINDIVDVKSNSKFNFIFQNDTLPITFMKNSIGRNVYRMLPDSCIILEVAMTGLFFNVGESVKEIIIKNFEFLRKFFYLNYIEGDNSYNIFKSKEFRIRFFFNGSEIDKGDIEGSELDSLKLDNTPPAPASILHDTCGNKSNDK